MPSSVPLSIISEKTYTFVSVIMNLPRNFFDATVIVLVHVGCGHKEMGKTVSHDRMTDFTSLTPVDLVFYQVPAKVSLVTAARNKLVVFLRFTSKYVKEKEQTWTQKMN
ncbi:hypothetical protein Tco_0151050 [Tanacetum coccineum]